MLMEAWICTGGARDLPRKKGEMATLRIALPLGADFGLVEKHATGKMCPIPPSLRCSGYFPLGYLTTVTSITRLGDIEVPDE